MTTFIVGDDEKVLVQENMGTVVRRWLAKHSMVAIERNLAESMAAIDGGVASHLMVYDPSSDTYMKKRA